jgi:membrane-associated phospholipid phosphatase
LEQFLKRFARIISTIFVPPSFTLIVFTILAFIKESDLQNQIITIAVAFIFGFTAPIALYFIFRKKNKLADLDASIKEERTIPFFISIGFYIMALLISIIFKLNIISIAFWFCYISNTLITIFINKQWKISAHSMGAAGSLAALTFALGPQVLYLFPIVLIVGWSRIQLKCHTFIQVFGGIVLAFVSTYLQIYLIVKYFS